MLEIAPGVYTQPDMSKAVRERVWMVLSDWFAYFGRGSVVMTWAAPNKPERQGLLVLGVPAKNLVEFDGCYLVRRDLPP
ncbi:MAG: type I-E CRISPR-associated endoribonuclease Cas2e [Bryobacterales bacterium]|nr:type I-E CRISPR-associated endoribonuclease Cas2e [Bryobacterales bacterium]